MSFFFYLALDCCNGRHYSLFIMKRIEILAAVLLAFSTGCVDGAGLTAAQWEWAEQEIEGRFGGDFDKLAEYLKAEMRACEAKCRAAEKV
jgi:hypothetical protein